MNLTFQDPQSIKNWKTVDDDVMGGVSASQIEWIDEDTEESENSGLLRFSGAVSLKNNGGFCSTRTTGTIWDLSKNKGLKLRLRSDGRGYQFTLRCPSIPDGASFRAPLGVDRNGWTTITVPFDDMNLWRRGKLLSTEKTIDRNSVESIGFLLADGKPGPFALDVAWVQSYR